MFAVRQLPLSIRRHHVEIRAPSHAGDMPQPLSAKERGDRHAS
jgi:hypothetical protein